MKRHQPKIKPIILAIVTSMSVFAAGGASAGTTVPDATADTDAVNLGQLTSRYGVGIGNGGVSLGEGALNGWHSVAVGENAKSNNWDSVAVGHDAVAERASVAVGSNVTVTGEYSVAVGVDSKVSASNSVAIGARASDGGQSGVVSVGNDGEKRRIINVADGVGDTDAVNLRQLNSRYGVGIGNGGVSLGEGALNGWHSVAVGENAKSNNWDSVAVGHDAVAERASVAVGSNVTVSGEYSVAVGVDSKVSANNSVALGSRANDGGQSWVVSLGNSGEKRRLINVANGVDDNDGVNMAQLNAVSAQVAQNTASITALRGGLKSTFGGTLLDSSANVSKVNAATTLGATSSVGAASIVAASLGGASPLFAADGDPVEVASASGVHALAIGANASASADNAVAIGSNSVADRANTVSVGAPGSERQITNVAAGTQSTDAVNVDQLNGAVKQANSYTDQAVAGANSYTDQAISGAKNEMKHYADRAAASTLAIPSIPMLNSGEKWVGTAVGNYGSATAVGLAAAYQATANLNIGLGVSTGTSGPVAMKAQAGYRW